MDLKAYLTPLIKYWWLLLLASLVAAASSYYVTRQQPLVFLARTTLVIGRAVYEPNPTNVDLYMSQQLASFYADLARRQQVRDATMAALGLTWLPEYTSRPLPNSQLLEIAVSDTNPDRAAAVANELANQLIKQTPTNVNQQGQDRQEFVNEQLAKLEAKIVETEAEITKKQEELEELISAMQIANTQQEINLLESKLTTLQTNYATLVANTGEGASNTISVIERANPPQSPIGPNKGMIVLLSSAIALTIAAGAAYLLEYLDDTLRTPEEINRLLNLPVIGYLSEMGRGSPEGIYVAKQPRSAIAEAYRALRTNLEFVDVDESLRTLLVTSPTIGEGKTSVATNLAIVMAQGGKKVLIVDADLRKPSLHRSLEVPNREGLSDVFRGRVELDEVVKVWGDDKINVITSGGLPPNPADLLGSKKMDAVLAMLKEKADIVIIDGPPFLVTDAAVMASKVDGVLLVIRHGYTRRGAAQAAMEQLNRAGARVVGVALNWIPRTSDSYLTHYRYYSNIYGDGDKKVIASNGRPRRWWAGRGRAKSKEEVVEPNPGMDSGTQAKKK